MTSVQRQPEKKVVIVENPEIPPPNFFTRNTIYKVQPHNQIIAALICKLQL